MRSVCLVYSYSVKGAVLAACTSIGAGEARITGRPSIFPPAAWNSTIDRGNISAGRIACRPGVFAAAARKQGRGGMRYCSTVGLPLQLFQIVSRLAGRLISRLTRKLNRQSRLAGRLTSRLNRRLNRQTAILQRVYKKRPRRSREGDAVVRLALHGLLIGGQWQHEKLFMSLDILCHMLSGRSFTTMNVV